MAWMSCDSASDVSGPVAMITGDHSEPGTLTTSPRPTVMRGCAITKSVMAFENAWRSTASAAPAGTRVASAARITSEPSRRISSLINPTALSTLSARNELLQTSSARPSVWWTAVGRSGRIS